MTMPGGFDPHRQSKLTRQIERATRAVLLGVDHATLRKSTPVTLTKISVQPPRL
jgi:hypothetical protein